MIRNRRDFLRSSALALSSGAAAAFVPQLGLAANLLAARGKAFGNYKALVCLYLAGGSDTWNFLVPRDSTAANSRYDTYRLARGGVFNATTNTAGLALDFNQLVPINPQGQPAGSWGLYPYMGNYTFTPQGGSSTTQNGMATLFNQGRIAILPNIGTLVEPMTKTEYINRTKCGRRSSIRTTTRKRCGACPLRTRRRPSSAGAVRWRRAWMTATS
ncbi:MAG: DUF1501 domain-containing protein [Ahniella sp.]|nr:DUF1501 domain-containing protein [Ahniella sp.]